jgi:hypothetical protein
VLIDKRRGVGASLPRDLDAPDDHILEESWKESVRKHNRKVAAETHRSRLEWCKHLHSLYQGRAIEYEQRIRELETPKERKQR